MSKAANFSFVAELPTYRTARHCCGLAKVTTLYFILTSLVTLQFVFLVVSSAPLDTAETNVLGLLLNIHGKSLVLFCILAAVFSVWVVLAIISFAGVIKRNPYFHLPLLTLEVSFCLLSSAGVAMFLWQIFSFSDKPTSKRIPDGPSKADLLHRAIFLAVLFICHAYYCYVIFSLFSDVKAKKETDAFIARQKMLDEVCEEMIWEEEEKYHGNTSLTMSGVYYQESICYSNGSIASRELSTYYLDSDRTYCHQYNQYNHQHQQPQRFVTFYDEDEDSY